MDLKHKMTVGGDVKEASIGASIIRCGCGNPMTIHPDSVCPTPRVTEEQGAISYYHKNPLRRALWEIKQVWKEAIK